MGKSLISWVEAVAEKPHSSLDEAEAATFHSAVECLPSFDQRSTKDLEVAAHEAPAPIERERAMWELCYRPGVNQGQLIEMMFDAESDPSIRWNLLWLGLKTAPDRAMALVQKALRDPHREVRDWAKLYFSEVTGSAFQSEYQIGTYVRARGFDQTLPLQIAGFAVLTLQGEEMKIVLSPLWFAHIQGRVMACTRVDTFATDLTIEKKYAAYHPDGSDHYEIYPFRGKSWASPDGRLQHRYLSKAVRPTYLSGKVEEDPENVVRFPVPLARGAATFARLIQVSERADSEEVQASKVTSIMERSVISDVRGQYFGWAFASTKHYVRHGDVARGSVQLVSPMEPQTASLINCYICGTFRGKLSDSNGDGRADINDEVCHGTPDGRLDYLGDGSLAADPFA